jgi:hypothetical protein
MLSGWIDASAAAFGAMEAIKKGTDAKRIVTFDPDSFIDYRVRRPMMELRDGKNNKLVWSAPEIYAGKDDNDRDVLILCGPEPDSAWLYFADVVGDLCLKLGVVKMFGIGAYPFPRLIHDHLSCRALPHRKLHLPRFHSLKVQPMFLLVWNRYWNTPCKSVVFKRSAYGVRCRTTLQPCPTLPHLPLL